MSEKPPQEEGVHEAAPPPPSLEGRVFDIYSDRRSFRRPGTAHVAAKQLAESLTDLPPDQEKNAEANLQSLALLNGHAGALNRNRALNSRTPEAKYLRELLTASKAEEPRVLGRALTSAPHPDLQGLTDPEALYERLTFLEKHPGTDRRAYEEALLQTSASALEHAGAKKWIDLVGVAFDAPQAPKRVDALMEQVGFIPTELLTKRAFRGLGAKPVVAAIESLRSVSDRDFQNERSKLTNYLFISKNAEQLRPKESSGISLDQNGLFINLKGFHSHLPYGLVREETIQELATGNWLAPQQLEELRVRRLEANSARTAYDERARVQVDEFAGALGIDAENSQELQAKLVNLIEEDPHAFARLMVQRNLIVPDALLERLVRQSADSTFLAMRLGEAASERMLGSLEWTPRKFTHHLLSEARETYDARRALMNDPGYYNVEKIAGSVVASDRPADPDARFSLLRGRYKRTREGGVHSFIEAVYEGDVARLLVDEKAFTKPGQREKFRSLPTFSPEQYQELESALVTFNNFSAHRAQIGHIIDDPRSTQDIVRFDQCRSSCEAGLHFLLTNVTDRYLEAKQLYEEEFVRQRPREGQEVDRDRLERLHEIFKDAHDRYSTFLYNAIGNPVSFLEDFNPSIKKRTVEFGETFVRGAKGRVAEGSLDENLSENAPPIRVVELNYSKKDPSATVPFHIEEAALNGLRLIRDRPLINVIGGAKLLARPLAEGEDPYDAFTESVMKVAHTYKANVAVPGTQSGIGNAFGRMNAHYRNTFGALPHKEQAHMFAISPGGSVYTPENPHLSAPPEETFAISPVDSILTPVAAGWELRGKDREHSPYRAHIDYMEGLYARVAEKDRRVAIISNGGLYSVMETIETLKNGFHAFFVKDSGRFAEVASIFADPRALHNLPIDASHGEMSRAILEELPHHMDHDAMWEFLNKDFGHEAVAKNEEQRVYRKFFFEFIALMRKGLHSNIRTVSFEHLEESLNAYLSKTGTEHRNTRAHGETL